VTYSVRNIAIAIVMAIAAAAAVLVYTTSYKQSVTRGQKRVDVLVATRDIPAGTKAEEAAGAMTLTKVLQDDRAPGAITSMAGFNGKVASQTIFAGQQIIASVFTSGVTGQNKSLLLSKTERAIRVVCDPNPSCLIGDIQVGDKVDVYETIILKSNLSGGGSEIVSRLLLPGVRILDLPATDAKKSGLSAQNSKETPTVMVAVSQQLASKMAWLDGVRDKPGAQVWFAVRPPDATAQDMPLTVETTTSMVTDGLALSQIQKLIAQLGTTGAGSKSLNAGGN
jgi:Flp pilus assembly protein CpaB